jgi:hypothetical protein
VVHVNESISIRSRISQSAPGGGLTMPEDVFGRVFPYNVGRIQRELMNRLEVRYLPGKTTSRFDRSAFDKYYNGMTPNERQITSAHGPVLGIQNQTILRALASIIEVNWEVFDNCAIYAKLAYWAMVIDCYTYIQQQPVAAVLDPATAPVWTDLDAAEPNIDLMTNLIKEHYIIFVEGFDFNRNDLLYL